MCIQTYVHFTCADTKILTQFCDAGATIAEVSPFYMPIACDDYRIISGRFPHACGLGHFYCAKGQDGAFLDQVYRQGQGAHDKMRGLNAELTRIKAGALEFRQMGLDTGTSLAQINQLAEHRQYMTDFSMAKQFEQGLMDTMCEAATVINQARAHFSQASQGVVGVAAAPDPIAGRSAAFLLERPHPMAVLSNIHYDSHYAAWHDQVPNQSFRPTHSQPSGDISRALPRLHMEQSAISDESRHIMDPGWSADADCQRRPIQYQPAPQTTITRTPAQSRRRGRAQSIETESNPEQPETVRRSARTRGKRISYAESLSSSRSVSPEKSDMSGFSPAESAVDDSPMKRPRLQRREPPASIGSALSSNIRDWKTRDASTASPLRLPVGGAHVMPSSLHTPSQSRTPTISTPVHTKQSAGNVDQKFQPRASQSVVSNAGTILDPTQNCNNGRRITIESMLQHPDHSAQAFQLPALSNSNATGSFEGDGGDIADVSLQDQRYSSMPAQRPSQPSSDVVASQIAQENFRRDSALVNKPVHHTEIDYDYDDLRRSFGSKPDFSQAFSVPTHTSIDVKDPRKRSLPEQSSSTPAKRMRPSLAWEDGASPSLPDDWLETSTGQRHESAAYPTDETTPAPFYAPPAVPYHPLDQVQPFAVPQHDPYSHEAQVQLPPGLAQTGHDDTLAPAHNVMSEMDWSSW